MDLLPSALTADSQLLAIFTIPKQHLIVAVIVNRSPVSIGFHQ